VARGRIVSSAGMSARANSALPTLIVVLAPAENVAPGHHPNGRDDRSETTSVAPDRRCAAPLVGWLILAGVITAFMNGSF
jgi:hypothetical protein